MPGGQRGQRVGGGIHAEADRLWEDRVEHQELHHPRRLDAQRVVAGVGLGGATRAQHGQPAHHVVATTAERVADPQQVRFEVQHARHVGGALEVFPQCDELPGLVVRQRAVG